MTASQEFITAETPMGATLVDGGATFRVWAPRARQVFVAVGDTSAYRPRAQDELVRHATAGHWAGFLPGVTDGTTYRFHVVGEDGSAAMKRDPRAAELHGRAGVDEGECVVRPATGYPWHDAGFRAPAFSELVVYQLHVGVYFARDAAGHDRRDGRVATLLDALGRVEYWAELGITAVQPLPVVEFHGEWSLGYNGTDLYSPETDYGVADEDLDPYLASVNTLLARRGHPPLERGQLAGRVNQLKAFVDVCHVHGIAVIFDVVYNHAGGGLDAASLDFLDEAPSSLYFSDREWAGGKIFRFGCPDVRSFLIDNAAMFLSRYHGDGLRFDEVRVIDGNGGWSLCQDFTSTLRFRTPSAVLIAEYWGDVRSLAVTPAPAGMGFDIGYDDRLRDSVRGVLAQVAGGADAPVDLGRLLDGLRTPPGFPAAWRAYTCLENHDLVLDAKDHGAPRIARLAGGNDPRSWFARSRARVATGLLLTAPGTPLLFMGQEFLEDKLWSDSVHRPDLALWWDGLEGADPVMGDFHACVRDLIRLRRRHPALRADPLSVYPLAADQRVLAFQRWVPGIGRDVVVVASFAEATFDGDYELGFPRPGPWREVFNSDFYDGFPNRDVRGNRGGIDVGGPPRHGLPASARITVPANGLLVFALDGGDP